MSEPIHQKEAIIDGLPIRYSEGGSVGPDAIIRTPSLESVNALDRKSVV